VLHTLVCTAGQAAYKAVCSLADELRTATSHCQLQTPACCLRPTHQVCCYVSLQGHYLSSTPRVALPWPMQAAVLLVNCLAAELLYRSVMLQVGGTVAEGVGA
jgi:hypothetical protein